LTLEAGFGLSAKGTPRVTTSCGKSENQLGSPHERSRASHGLDGTLNARREGKSERKKFSRFIPRNSLKRLDSDERIQGNPRKSNTQKRGFSQRNRHAPRKPKLAGQTNIAGPFAGRA
jgi:hypothetical protein